jgi:serine/threonine protein kinase
MIISIKEGAQIGRWQITGLKPLGEGGNSTVWKAASPDGTEVAIKFLFERHLSNSRYSRFVDEIRYLQTLGFKKGIVPLVDYYLPDTPSRANRPWLATRLALPLATMLAQNGGGLTEVVKATAEVADVLADIHALGAAHRDIKPDNLFHLDGVAAVGDFGLVDYPEKEAITSNSERMGPLFFIAPEMMTGAEEIDARPADVYSLAKTLWVLGTGQKFPLPGELRNDTHQARLSSYVKHERAFVLDLLLERSTRHSPAFRPSMRQFLEELSAWLTPAQSLQAADLSQISDRFRPLMAKVQAAEDTFQVRHTNIIKIKESLKEYLETTKDQVQGAIGFRCSVEGNTHSMLRYFPRPDATAGSMDLREDCSLQCVIPMRPPAYRVALAIGFIMDINPAGEADLTGAQVVDAGPERRLVKSAVRRFSVGTAQGEHAVSELLNELTAALPVALETLAREIAIV